MSAALAPHPTAPKLWRWLGLFWALLVFAFLYAPIATLVAYSFNDSNVATHWGGWTLKWYGAVFADAALMEGFWLSLQLALASASAAVLIGAAAAYALTRANRSPAQRLLGALMNVPLLMPSVVLALALLLFFTALREALGVPERGFFTLWVGHVLMAASYAATVIQSRLTEMDRNLEEAAMDLGAKPAAVFFLVTLPVIAPSVLAAWLLSFSLSLDEVVISAFLSGPGNTPLPVVMLGRARLGLSPTLNAVGALIVYAVTLFAMLAHIVWLRRSARLR